MDIFQAVLLGIVEGVTEFLPISSTFHLIWTAKLLQIPETDFLKLFEVFIQAGAILAVVLLYFKTLKQDKDLIKKTLTAFIPTAVIGFVLYRIIKDVFFTTELLMLGLFISLGLVFIVYENFLKKKPDILHNTLTQFTYKHALLIGLFQGFAVIPGVSRAGAVIFGMMFLSYRRDEAARFSFLLAVPTIFAASAYDLFKMRDVVFAYGGNILILTTGFITAFISAYVVIKWFIQFLQTHTLTGFGWYRIVVGFLLLLLSVK